MNKRSTGVITHPKIAIVDLLRRISAKTKISNNFWTTNNRLQVSVDDPLEVIGTDKSNTNIIFNLRCRVATEGNTRPLCEAIENTNC